MQLMLQKALSRLKKQWNYQKNWVFTSKYDLVHPGYFLQECKKNTIWFVQNSNITNKLQFSVEIKHISLPIVQKVG
jgi:hypothetical protein